MKRILSVLLLSMVALALFGQYEPASADAGIVLKEDLLGGNVIIETTDGTYVAAKYHSGDYLHKDDVVYGDLQSEGIQTICSNGGLCGKFYLKNYNRDLKKASDEFCE